MNERFQHATCTWPNGEARRVRHRHSNGYFRKGLNPVLWLEEGFIFYETVPFSWLSEFGYGMASRTYNKLELGSGLTDSEE